MNKVLISAALAVAVIANGSAFANADIDNALYEEAHFFASNDATIAMPSSTPLSAETAALYEETPSVAAAQSVDLSEQLADSGLGQFRGWTSSIQATPSRFSMPE